MAAPSQPRGVRGEYGGPCRAGRTDPGHPVRARRRRRSWPAVPRAGAGRAPGQALLQVIETQPAVDPHHRLPVQHGSHAEIRVGHGGQIGERGGQAGASPRPQACAARRSYYCDPESVELHLVPTAPGQAVCSGTVSAGRARARSTGPASPGGRGRAAAMHPGCAGARSARGRIFASGVAASGCELTAAGQRADGGRSTMGWK